MPETVTPHADVESRVFNKITLRLIPFMFVLYVVSYLDRINVSFAGLQMNQALNFNDEIFGLGGGIFFIGYFLFGIPSNLMVERLGARKWISLIMILWGIVSVMMVTIESPLSFYILRFLLGVAEAGFFPGMILYLTYWFPRRLHGTAVARFMTAIPAAGVLGGLISAQLLGMSGTLGLPGWKWLFICTGLPAVILGVVVFFYLTDRPELAAWLSDDERQWLIEHISVDSADAKAAPSAMLSALRNSRVWLLAAIYFSLTLGMYGFQLWLPQIIHAFGGLSDATTALLSAIPAVFQALGMIVIAGHSDARGERRWHVALSAALAAAGLVATGCIKDPVISLMTLSLTALGIWGTVGPFWALPTAYLSRQSAAGGIALINSVGNLGGFAGPYLVGLIKKHTADFSHSLFAMALSLTICAALVLLVKQDRR
jgi:ACS family tartrate transporter-like MFS transporter